MPEKRRRYRSLFSRLAPADGALVWALLERNAGTVFSRLAMVFGLALIAHYVMPLLLQMLRLRGRYGYGRFNAPPEEYLLGVILATGIFYYNRTLPATAFISRLKRNGADEHLFAVPIKSYVYSRCFLLAYIYSAILIFIVYVGIGTSRYLMSVFLNYPNSTLWILAGLFGTGLAFSWVAFWATVVGRLAHFAPWGLMVIYWGYVMTGSRTSELIMLNVLTAIYAVVTLATLIYGLIRNQLPACAPSAFILTFLYVFITRALPKLHLDWSFFLMGWIVACLALGTAFYLNVRWRYCDEMRARLFP
ncbi:MAG: hypothetical protein K1X53_07165 [Candidatus Sumerlaeaceae bacterium]|nr:hypothetical protein [Candidatus Sumerlaeaceae bacterium]